MRGILRESLHSVEGIAWLDVPFTVTVKEAAMAVMAREDTTMDKRARMTVESTMKVIRDNPMEHRPPIYTGQSSHLAEL